MEPPVIDDIENGLDEQRTELANKFRQLRESVRFNNVQQGLAEGADAVAAVIASVIIRNPIPVAIAGSVVLLLLANRRRIDSQPNEAATPDLGRQCPDRRAIPHSEASRINAKVVQAASDVFANWTAAISTSMEHFCG
jgi:hypothetical protein